LCNKLSKHHDNHLLIEDHPWSQHNQITQHCELLKDKVQPQYPRQEDTNATHPLSIEPKISQLSLQFKGIIQEFLMTPTTIEKEHPSSNIKLSMAHYTLQQQRLRAKIFKQIR
jgi:hypothetical protein